MFSIFYFVAFRPFDDEAPAMKGVGGSKFDIRILFILNSSDIGLQTNIYWGFWRGSQININIKKCNAIICIILLMYMY